MPTPLPPTAEVTSQSFPFQVEGTMPDGQAFYFRARGGSASFDVAPTLDEAVMGTGKVSLTSAVCQPIECEESRYVLATLYARAANIALPEPEVTTACLWFAACDNQTTTAIVHPVLGVVPCCTRCAMRVEAFDSLVEIGTSVTVDSENSVGTDTTEEDWGGDCTHCNPSDGGCEHCTPENYDGPGDAYYAARLGR